MIDLSFNIVIRVQAVGVHQQPRGGAGGSVPPPPHQAADGEGAGVQAGGHLAPLHGAQPQGGYKTRYP